MRRLIPIVLVLSLLAAPVSARDEWYDYYDSALTALDRGDYVTAAGLIGAALERKKRSGYLRTYGNNYIRYVPYFQLGVAHHGADDCEAALAAFSRSESRAETADVPEYRARLERLREDCELRLSPPAFEPPATTTVEPAAIVEPEPRRPPIHRASLEAGLAAYLEGDFTGSIERFERLTQAHPGSARLHLLLGMSLHGAWVTGGESDDGLIDRARAELTGAKSLDPGLVPDPALCPPRVAALFRSLR